MSKSNATYAYFRLRGDDLDPALITKIVGATPSDSWKRGELHPNNQRARTFGTWTLRSRLEHADPLEHHIADVLAQLDQNPDGFQQVSQTYGAYMQLVGYFNSHYPGLTFTPAVVQGLAKYKLGVDHDFYYPDPADCGQADD